MKPIHQLRNEDYGAVCAFHPALNVIACANAAGEIAEYDITPNK
jgi:hypothetical protein